MMTKHNARRAVPPSRLLTGTLLAVLLGSLAAPSMLAAQAASLVRDIETTEAAVRLLPARPQSLLAAGGKVFFSASQASTGRELWVTDGTPLGTELLADICHGGCNTAITPLAAAGPLFFFSATPEDSGDRELWRSDGTRRGTFALTFAGLHSAVQPTATSPFALAGNVLYFEGCISDDLAAPLCGPARSDGTVAGTGVLKGLGGEGSDPISAIVVAGGRVFFTTPRELWSSDGTTAGTAVAATLDGMPSLLTAAAHRVYLAVGASHPELWTSDGTRAGSQRLATFAGADAFRQTTGFKVAGDRSYFVAGDAAAGAEVWVTDGTVAGTHAATRFANPDPFGFAASGRGLPLADLALLGNRLIFPAAAAPGQWRLWRTDGSPQSAAQVAALDLGAPRPLVGTGGRVVFVAAAAGGSGIAATDGTAAGTVSLGALPGTVASGPLPALGEAVFVLALGPPGSQVWVSDGTPAGTRSASGDTRLSIDPASFDATMLASSRGRLFFTAADNLGDPALFVAGGGAANAHTVEAGGAATGGSNPQAFAALADTVFFRARQKGQEAVWRSTGTAASTVAVTDFEPPDLEPADPPVAAGGKVFFWHLQNGHLQLFAADRGTPAVALTHFTDDSGGAPPAPLGNQVFFPVAGSPDQVWSSDGTPEGTGERFELPHESIFFFAAGGGKIYFFATRTPPFSAAVELWTSDGTAAGTQLVNVLGNPNGLPGPLFTTVGPLVFFRFGTTIWRTDGTGEGTFPVFDGINVSNIVVSEIPGVAALGGSFYFLAEKPDVSYLALWRSDGTVAGTVEIPFITTAPIGGEEIVAAGGKLFLLAPQGATGRELVVSDGTDAEPLIVKDILPGTASSQPSGLTAVGDRVYFSADDGIHGFEPWTSDGTEAGTRLVQDIAPEALSSNPSGFTVAGGLLFFAADDALHGREPWALPLAAPTGCQPSATALCLAGRFRVEAAWRALSSDITAGEAVALTGDTGYFWFFSPQSAEVVVKVLDGTAVNGSFWVFAGGLSTVEYTLTVTDTQTGLTRRDFNPAGALASFADTNAFGPDGAFRAPAAAVVRTAGRGGSTLSRSIDPGAKASAPADRNAGSASCAATPTLLCLAGNRFAIAVDWKDFQGRSGKGEAVQLSDASADGSGYFWFFNPANVELLVKVIDGTAVNGRFWLFYGALSSVEYTVTVTDLQTGASRQYSNPAGALTSVADTNFP